MKRRSHGELVGDGAYDQDMKRAVGELQPDVVVLDINMLELDPLRVIGHLKEQNPRLKVLVLTDDADSEFAAGLLSTGVEGEVALPHVQVQRLTHEVNEPHSLRERNNGDRLERLTPRELEVLTLIGKGADNAEIAWMLSIAKRTVETHVHNIYGKLGLKKRSQAILYSIERGLVENGRQRREHVVDEYDSGGVEGASQETRAQT
ncbi:MAG: LuxR C-terminal-related transcriptional regulator [Anaerolineae bacterium]